MRIGLAVLAVAGLASLPFVIGAIDEGKEEGEQRERAEAVRIAARERVRLTADQRPHHARGGDVPALQRAIQADVLARHRRGTLPPPAAKRTRCRPVEGESATTIRRTGVRHYKCLALTTETDRLVLGFDFVAAIDTRRERLVWCKTNPLPGEGLAQRRVVDVPLEDRCYRP